MEKWLYYNVIIKDLGSKRLYAPHVPPPAMRGMSADEARGVQQARCSLEQSLKGFFMRVKAQLLQNTWAPERCARSREQAELGLMRGGSWKLYEAS